MADFCCYHSSEEVVSLGVGESFFLNTGPKNGASSAPNWDVLGCRHESVCLLLNIAQ